MTTWSYTIPSTPVFVETPSDFLARIDHVTTGQGFVLWQYAHCERLLAWLESLLAAMQSLEDLAQDVMEGFRLPTAVGVQLDVLGRLVGEPRATWTDDEYRAMIAVRILINRCSSHPDEILDILALFSEDLQLHETPPAAGWVEQVEVALPVLARSVLSEIEPGGVRLDYVYSEQEGGVLFTCGEYASAGVDEDRGWSSTYEDTTGGQWAGVLA